MQEIGVQQHYVLLFVPVSSNDMYWFFSFVFLAKLGRLPKINYLPAGNKPSIASEDVPNFHPLLLGHSVCQLCNMPCTVSLLVLEDEEECFHIKSKQTNGCKKGHQ